MAIKLHSLLTPRPPAVSREDVFASFLRAARSRWGERMPLLPVRYARGTLTVRCPSPLWRTELLFAAEELAAELEAASVVPQTTRLGAVLS